MGENEIGFEPNGRIAVGIFLKLFVYELFFAMYSMNIQTERLRDWKKKIPTKIFSRKNKNKTSLTSLEEFQNLFQKLNLDSKSWI